MHIYGKSNLWAGEKSELLYGVLSWRYHQKWYTKEKVIHTFKKMWDFSSFNIKVNKIFWDEDVPWKMNDTVFREQIAFDMYSLKDLDALVGYLFQASIEGYTIRYVSTDTLTGIYLERSNDNSTNIDEDVISTLVEAVENEVRDKKPKDR